MKTKSWWQKLPVDEKIIIILFLAGFIFLILGLIILLTIKINTIFSGFNFIYYYGVINTLIYYNSTISNITLFLLKLGTIFTIFLMPVCAGCSIIWFVIKRLLLKK